MWGHAWYATYRDKNKSKELHGLHGGRFSKGHGGVVSLYEYTTCVDIDKGMIVPCDESIPLPVDDSNGGALYIDIKGEEEAMLGSLASLTPSPLNVCPDSPSPLKLDMTNISPEATSLDAPLSASCKSKARRVSFSPHVQDVSPKSRPCTRSISSVKGRSFRKKVSPQVDDALGPASATSPSLYQRILAMEGLKGRDEDLFSEQEEELYDSVYGV